jgi:hypothetical protein
VSASSARSATRARLAACAIALAGLLSGCARIDAALGQQWVVVQLSSDTTLATARQVTVGCSHVPGMHPEPVKPTSPGGVVASVRFNATKATDADVVRLQRCLRRFPVVEGMTFAEPGQ